MNSEQDTDSQPSYQPPLYYYKGRLYKLLNTIQHKNKLTREWETVALYQDAAGVQYTRDITEFEDRFEEIRGPVLDPLHR